MRLLLYKPVQQYESYTVVCRFVEELAQGFVALGHEIHVFDCNKDFTEQELRYFLDRYQDGIISFGALPYVRLENGGNIYEEYGIPLVLIRLDHPLNNPACLTLVSRQITTLIDPSHAREMPFHFGSSLNSHFLPHGGCTGGCTPPAPDCDRPIDVLFSAHYTAPEEVLLRTKHWIYPLPQMFEEMRQEAMCQHTVPFLQVAQHAFDKRGLTYDHKVMYVGHLLHQAWDFYVRCVRRTEFLLALEKAGIAVDVYGTGWENYPTLGLHRFHGRKDFDGIISTLGRSKVLINAGTNLPEGSHERLLTGMVAGCATVTEEMLFFTEQFGQAHCSYRCNAIEQGVQQVVELLGQPIKRLEMAQSAQHLAISNHTWASRAQQLEALLNTKCRGFQRDENS